MDPQAIDAYFEKQIQEIQAVAQIESLTSRLPELVAQLKDAAPLCATARVAALLASPAFHPNAPRLEALAHLVCLHATGDKPTTGEKLDDWLNNHLMKSAVCLMEDPVEDVFISNVITSNGNCRVFQGIWDNPDFWLQEVVDILETTPNSRSFVQLRDEVHALLALGELLAQRFGVERNVVSAGQPGTVLAIPQGGFEEQSNKVVFSVKELAEAGVEFKCLAPFLLRKAERATLAHGQIGNSALERHPLLEFDGRIAVSIPSAFGSTVRRYVLERMDRLGQLATFTQALRRKQQQRVFFETLRNGPILSDQSQLLPRSQIDPRWFSERAIAFDTGRVAHVCILHDDTTEILGAVTCPPFLVQS